MFPTVAYAANVEPRVALPSRAVGRELQLLRSSIRIALRITGRGVVLTGSGPEI